MTSRKANDEGRKQEPLQVMKMSAAETTSEPYPTICAFGQQRHTLANVPYHHLGL